jgi:AbrB family looped-hinge helix DNA binding protein
MKGTGIVRRIDDLGRIVIPKEIRRFLGLAENDPMEVFVDSEKKQIIFQQYKQSNYREMWDELKKRKNINNETLEEIEKYYSGI